MRPDRDLSLQDLQRALIWVHADLKDEQPPLGLKSFCQKLIETFLLAVGILRVSLRVVVEEDVRPDFARGHALAFGDVLLPEDVLFIEVELVSWLNQS